jgi:hypothetical protein
MASAQEWEDYPHFHLSKSTIGTFEDCRLRYKFDKIDKRTAITVATAASVRGQAGHAAVSAVLSAPGGSADNRYALISRALGAFDISTDLRGTLAGYAAEAEDFARNRGGHFRWIEEFKCMECHSGVLKNVTLWAKPDLAILDGYIAPLEVIDWTFGKPRVESADELVGNLSTSMLRLVAGHNDRSRRPIAITEVHVPTMTSITVVPTDEDVMAAWERVCDIATEIRTAIATGEFPAQPGPWCRYCGHVDICPVQQAPI